jgi:hypothetical protein
MLARQLAIPKERSLSRLDVDLDHVVAPMHDAQLVALEIGPTAERK